MYVHCTTPTINSYYSELVDQSEISSLLNDSYLLLFLLIPFLFLQSILLHEVSTTTHISNRAVHHSAFTSPLAVFQSSVHSSSSLGNNVNGNAICFATLLFCQTTTAPPAITRTFLRLVVGPFNLNNSSPC